MRSWLYDHILGGSICIPTWKLYEAFLSYIPDNSKILDIGVGTGLHFEQCAKIIIKKNLSIHGYDIDADYIATAQERIKKFKLVNCTASTDPLDSNLDTIYDYSLFCEVYPVIPKPEIANIINMVRGYSKQIIFIHNIAKPNAVYKFLKPKLKYIPLFWVDFGRLVTMKDFRDFCASQNLNVNHSQVLIEKFGVRMYIFMLSN